MRVVVQRCSRAEVRIDGERVGQIEKGFVLLVGITDTDTREHADLLAKKIAQLRVFEDADGKMNLGHYVTKIPPDITPTGLLYVYVACLLNNHHQDGKGQGAIERIQDVAAIRRAAAVDVLAVPVNFC